MKRLKSQRYIFLVFLLLACSRSLFAQSSTPAASGMSFLKLSGSAEITALGDDHVAGIMNPSDIRLNPAVAAILPSVQTTFNYDFLPTEGNTDLFVASSRANSGFALALTAYVIREGEIEVRDAPTIDPLYTSIPQNFSLGATAAMRLFDSLSAGITLKWLNEKITIYNADGYGFDFGLHYAFLGQYQAGFAIQDVGRMGKLLDEASQLPARATLTFAAEPSWLAGGAFHSKILLTHQQSLLDKTNHSSFGLAENYNDALELRVGYVTNNDVRGVSFGVGVHYNAFSLDYSFAPSLNDFNTTNVFGLSVVF